MYFKLIRQLVTNQNAKVLNENKHTLIIEIDASFILTAQYVSKIMRQAQLNYKIICIGWGSISTFNYLYIESN